MESNEFIRGIDTPIYDMMNTNPRYEKNNKGVNIKVCCASCRFEECEDGLIRSQRTANYRRCSLTGGVCEKHGVCEAWDMKHRFAEWKGFGDGDVKSKEYLDWFRQKYVEWKRLEDEAPENEKKLISMEYAEFRKSAKRTYKESGRKIYVL